MRKRPRTEPKALKEMIPGVLSGIRRSLGGRVALVRRIWPEIVGEETAARTRVASLENGVLSVEVPSAALKHDLSTFRHERILKELSERMPGVPLETIRYRVGTSR